MRRGRRLYQEYQCHCGHQVIRRADYPITERSSCGCTRYENLTIRPLRRTHGMSKTNLYAVWANLRTRCDNKKYRLYKDYGGRGISYDPAWSLFEKFYEDMGSTYSSGLQLDRKDNNGNYCKENCWWVTRTENNNNKRNNVAITHNGKTQNLTQWAKELNLNPTTLHMRIRKYRMPLVKALTSKKNV